MAIDVKSLFGAHRSHRIDPKYHLFKQESHKGCPQKMTRWRLGDLLKRRKQTLVPNSEPDVEFRTITVTQDGEIIPRSAGIGNNPPAWFGTYFKPGTKWFRVRSGDLVYSRIDIWRGCVSIVTEDFEGAIVTNEFPVYSRVRPEVLDLSYLKLLLRAPHFQRAIRSITTGHSNRRRTQDRDFEDLEICLPDIDVQKKIVSVVTEKEGGRNAAETSYQDSVRAAEAMIMGIE